METEKVSKSARPKVSHEMAVQEFERFADCMDICRDPQYMNSESAEDFEDLKSKIVYEIERGNLVINDNGEPVYTPKLDPRDPITFSEPTGASFLAIDSKKKGQDMGKVFAMLADFTKQTPARFASMKARDLKPCQAIMQLFLA